MFELRSAGDVLILEFSRKPRNRPLTIAVILFIASAAFYAFVQRFPDWMWLHFIIATIGAAIAIGLLAVRPEVTGVITRFDNATRNIGIVTRRSDASGDSEAVPFDDVRTLQLFQQRFRGTQVQTLTLIRRSGGKILLGEDRQHRGFMSPPFDDRLAAMVARLRSETGIGAVEDLPMPVQAAGVVIGVDRR